MPDQINIAVFASGTGTNFQNIVEYFEGHDRAAISTLVTNKPDCGAAQIAVENGIDITLISNTFITNNFDLIAELQNKKIDWIILAGFLRKIPESLIELFENRIINLHPSLLPAFGGKGMYGRFVHEAVISSGVKESGITIHLVNEDYDKGEILFQTSCKVETNDTPKTLAEKIHILEKNHFPVVIEKTITNGL